MEQSAFDHEGKCLSSNCKWYLFIFFTQGVKANIRLTQPVIGVR